MSISTDPRPDLWVTGTANLVILHDKSRMRIGDLVVCSPSPKPNVWYRFWARVLCGIRWEDVLPATDQEKQ